MRIQSFRVSNFRRLKNVRVDMEENTSIFVGANNSGKTSATHIFQLFLGDSKGSFSVYDFTADCWEQFNRFGSAGDADVQLPVITLDLWLEVDELNVHRVVDLLPSLDWDGSPVGIRMCFKPKDTQRLLQNFTDARQKAEAAGEHGSTYKPWPQNLTEYLSKRLKDEYEITYAAIDFNRCSSDLTLEEGYQPFPLANGPSVVGSLIRIDFLDAQRNLSDTDSRGRHENLSKRLGRFYSRNLTKHENDIAALRALADSEQRLNDHYDDVFSSLLAKLAELGYPGFNNHRLVIKAEINPTTVLNGSAQVHYALPSGGNGSSSNTAPMLPDQYNGLGFKNLIYMVVEVLDFHYAWTSGDGERPPIHLVIIEEPEAHLHAQLQQVFIRKIYEVLPDVHEGFVTQMAVTTHSAHIIYEKEFRPIRYFRRIIDSAGNHISDVRDLSRFYEDEEEATRSFLAQYLKLTHCDLFFADAAVLVEGNVERLLLPLIIEKSRRELRSCHLTILEVGGAFAHKFDGLLKFIDLPTLVITDLDSASPRPAAADGEDDEADEVASTSRHVCRSDTPGAVTTNETLAKWVPGLRNISELLAADEKAKFAPHDQGRTERIRVAYQTLRPVTWNGDTKHVAGRTLEEAFALQNLEWVQDKSRQGLGLYIRSNQHDTLLDLWQKIYERVRGLDKTKFALGLMAQPSNDWSSPAYIVEGLSWLWNVLDTAEVSSVVADLEPEVR